VRLASRTRKSSVLCNLDGAILLRQGRGDTGGEVRGHEQQLLLRLRAVGHYLDAHCDALPVFLSFQFGERQSVRHLDGVLVLSGNCRPAARAPSSTAPATLINTLLPFIDAPLHLLVGHTHRFGHERRIASIRLSYRAWRDRVASIFTRAHNIRYRRTVVCHRARRGGTGTLEQQCLYS